VDVIVLFSDVRKLASYKLAMSADLRRTDDPGSVSIQITAHPATEPIR
jgi:hypothetical protein